MADKNLTVREAEEEFWNHLEKSNTGMLGLDQPGYHAQPMTAYRDKETSTIWFFTREDTDLAKDVGAGQSAMFHYGSKDQNVWACIHGQLSVQGHDRELIERYWNPVLAAWYPEGKDDPKLTILRFEAGDGRVWVSEGGFFKFAYEIAKANVTKTVPDTGDVVDVNLR
ncbi:MAG: pyridoxamine 5'-phosphate oxidase family protein [Alphaproteobacteria bacterium]|nr:pyridoxamine 5'-phosphate oxidase family protein [Alphaproteobacteria bacterium]MBU2270474.1 pyridoxamine 5'-phosphate oxidase family protein [Alphaproteobacteria bacterium]MBU2418843.1 pyridoxamine 5'-phosphate oxidase family protein [Alphaproteobacteria bacterium]